jgi:hypothetical protein
MKLLISMPVMMPGMVPTIFRPGLMPPRIIIIATAITVASGTTYTTITFTVATISIIADNISPIFIEVSLRIIAPHNSILLHILLYLM